MIRDRRQRYKRVFDAFYDDMLMLVDRLNQLMSNKTLIEIVRRYFRPEVTELVNEEEIDQSLGMNSWLER